MMRGQSTSFNMTNISINVYQKYISYHLHQTRAEVLKATFINYPNFITTSFSVSIQSADNVLKNIIVALRTLISELFESEHRAFLFSTLVRNINVSIMNFPLLNSWETFLKPVLSVLQSPTRIQHEENYINRFQCCKPL